MTEHMLHQLSADNQKDILAAEKGDKAAKERVVARRNAAIAVTAVAAGGYALVYGGRILIAGSAEMATAGRIALEGCKANPALCLNNVGIFVADAVAPEAAVGTGVLAAGAVKVLGNTKEGAKNLAEELSHASKPLLSNAKPDTHVVASLIEKEALYAENNALGAAASSEKGTTGSVVGREKTTLDRIGKNNKNTDNLSKKEVNSVYNQQLIKNAETISTAKPGQQFTTPRDLNEQILWNQVKTNPSKGQTLPRMNNAPRFPESAGFQKMQVNHQLPDGSNITIHYQYNSITGKAYDMKITTPQRNPLQPGTSIIEGKK
ncbi:hypothetical protein [Photorhabdus antumapuensis]|uniref:hypothetical protein n=1 Tax=Photorhabdus antumapuensis TaxID=2862867 RepID=UPI001CED59AD|nr:hypothetical protein [Photorhabdus antumapuensis]MCA6222770.1 hypothetical protein [Photorhabdus antumapuensis]